MPIRAIRAPATRELGYAQITSDYGGSGLAAAEADVTGLSVTVTCDGVSPVEIEFFGLAQKQANAGAMFFYLFEGATRLATGNGNSLAVGEFMTGSVKARLVPSAGAHTYKVRMAMTSVGGRVQASASGGATGPSYLSVTQR